MQWSYRYFLLLSVFVFLGGLSHSFGQSQHQVKRLEGTVSFITSQNVYLRFEHTDNLVLNDTIFITDGTTDRACLRLLQKSSISCIAERIGDCKISKGDVAVYFYKDKHADEVHTQKSNSRNQAEIIKEDTIPTELVETSEKLKTPRKQIDGRFSLANYTTSGSSGLNSRSVARLSLNAKNILGSKFSFYNYLHFRNNTIDNRNSGKNRLNLYEFAFKYDPDSSLTLSLGRTINTRMLSIGAMDGLHAEKRWKRTFAGASVGSSPDPINYNLNLDLMQYGAYIGMFHNKHQSSSTSVGILEQRNKGLTDRRYAFLQHNSNLGKKIRLFSTAELDLFDKDTIGKTSSTPRLYSFYISMNYRITKKVSLMTSYDLRKNLILYESFAESLETLTKNDPYKSGYRFRVNYRVTDNIYTGGNVSLRKQSDNKSSFTNFNVYLNFSKVPGIGGRWSNSLSINRNEYFQYNSISTRYTKDLLKNKLSLAPNARFIAFSYNNYDIAQIYQIYFGIDTHYEITKDLNIGALYDYSKRSNVTFHRFNINIIKRF